MRNDQLAAGRRSLRSWMGLLPLDPRGSIAYPEQVSETPQQVPILVANSEDSGLRLDAFVAAKLGVGRRAATRLAVGARVNGQRAAKGRSVQAGDEVTLRPAPDHELATIPDPEILREDADLLVLNKPAGLPSVALAGNPGPSTARWLAQRIPRSLEIGRSGECGLVHRLDNQTSGLLLAARSEEVYEELRNQFREHTVEKTYLALVSGRVERPFIIDAPIGQHQKSRTRVRCLSEMSHPRYQVTPASTAVRPIALATNASLIEARTRTGARHQVRAHLAHSGHPLVADHQYGVGPTADMPHHLLHASALQWEAPRSNESHRASCLPPESWSQTITKLTGENLLEALPAD